jgi:hypothetical protein
MSPRRSASLQAVVAALSAAAGGIHLAVTQDHLHQSTVVGAFFAVVGSGQVAWAVAVATTASRSLLVAGTAGNAGLVGLWLLSRTVGLPVGAEWGAPEPVGLADLFASALEVGVIWGSVALVGPALRRPVRRRPDPASAAASGPAPSSGPAHDRPPARDAPGPRGPLRPLPEWLTVGEAALLVGTTAESVRGWVREGRVAQLPLAGGRNRSLTLLRARDVVAVGSVDMAAWGFGPPPDGAPRPRPGNPALARWVAWAAAAALLLAVTGGGLLVTDRLVSAQGSAEPGRADDGGAGARGAADPGGAGAGRAADHGGRGHHGSHDGRSAPGDSHPQAAPPEATGAPDPTLRLLRPARGPTVRGTARLACARLLHGGPGSCGRASMAGGAAVWVVRDLSRGPEVRIYTLSRSAGRWVLGLRSRVAGARRAAVLPADLTGDGRPELLVGFRLGHASSALAYEVVTYPPGGRPRVAHHAWVERGVVSVRGGEVREYYGLRPDGRCCGQWYLGATLRWDGSAFRPVPAPEPVPAASVPPSDF